jgi:hypothetical protein
VTIEAILHEGTDHAESRTIPIDLASTAPVEMALSGGRRKEVLPYQGTPVEPMTVRAGDAKTPRPGGKPVAPVPTPAGAADALRP